MINRKTIFIGIVLAASFALAQTAMTQSEPATDVDTEDEFSELFGSDEEAGVTEEFEISDIEESDEFSDDESEEDESEEEFVDPRIAAEDRASTGGWYLDEFQIRYRPTGHEDRLIRAWTDVSASQSAEMYAQIFSNVSHEDSPGSCFKCHSIDTVNDKTQVNWKVRQSDPQIHEFNRFSHVAHFNLLDQKGCGTCHSLNKEADYASGFENHDPSTFASNFQSISEQTCIECHQEDKVGESCMTCHNYHIGEFNPTVSSEIKVITGE